MSESLLEMVRTGADDAFVEALGTIDASGKFAERAANGEEGETLDEAAIASLRAIQGACSRASDSLMTILEEIRTA